MRIDDVSEIRELHHVGLGLAESEAEQLRDALEALRADPNPRRAHLSSVEYDREPMV